MAGASDHLWQHPAGETQEAQEIQAEKRSNLPAGEP